jgi:hypothetical protein
VAPLLAVLDDGLLVDVGSGSSCAVEFAALVAVGEGSSWAPPGESESSASMRSTGAAGGNANSPSAKGGKPPPRSTPALVLDGAESPPPMTPVASKPPEIVRVPPATNAMAIAFGLMTALLVPLHAGSLEATSLRQTWGVTRKPLVRERLCRISLLK